MSITRINKHLYEQLSEQNNNEFSIIEHYGLNKFEILTIVNEWYLNGMFDGIIEDEFGSDLAEVISNEIEKINE